MTEIRTYRDLLVWKKGIEIAKGIYALTGEFTRSELYGLTSQIRRCAVSIPSNIAEGYGRQKTGDYVRFLSIAMGSLFELETQLLIAKEIGYLTDGHYEEISKMIDEDERMLSALIRKVKEY